jgi:N-methylhydantoinase A/oxoprolinase/acetone carboxylase beta subunit
MTLIVGLDTGGTYTDAVLFDPEHGVLATAKSLTTKENLSLGLAAAIEKILHQQTGRIDLVSLSTTLATNAVVEGHGNPIGLILIGFGEESLKKAGLGEALAGDPVAFITGGHTVFGTEQDPLDIESVTKSINTMNDKVCAFAIAGMFAVRNAAHEKAVRQLVLDITGKPATCSHELTSKLDAPRRALTTVLNARLIPQLQHLIKSVYEIMHSQGIDAPLMVVKGDGSLVDAEMALRTPVETILSGPAASIVGAQYLAGEPEGIVVDMGGTTSDLALLHDGTPMINEEGAQVGGWKTMVEAVSIHTFGLGGDSEVHVALNGSVTVGPRRVMPMSLLVDQHPHTLAILKEQLQDFNKGFHGQFVARLRALPEGSELTNVQQRLWASLEKGPLSMNDLQRDGLVGRAMDHLLDRGLIIKCGFTPSDATHVLGKHHAWSRDGAVVAAQLWMRKQGSEFAAKTPEEFAQQVLEAVTVQSGRAVMATLISESTGQTLSEADELGKMLVDACLSPRLRSGLLFEPQFVINRPLVAIGAPVASYYPEIASRLNTKLVVPEHASVANAVGAAASGIMQRVSVLVSVPSKKTFRVLAATEGTDFTTLEKAIEFANAFARNTAISQATEAGGEHIEVTLHRKDASYHTDLGEEILIESIITAVATGRPKLKSTT